MTKNSVLVSCGIFVALAIAAGCGKRTPTIDPNRAPVTGAVSLEGVPLRGGIIMFLSVKDPTYRITCIIKPDGTFTVADAPAGDVVAAVDTESQKFNNPSNYVPIPSKYWKTKTSGLKATITKGDPAGCKLDFDLKSK